MTIFSVNALNGDDLVRLMRAHGRAHEEVRAETSLEDWLRLETQNTIDMEKFHKGGFDGMVDGSEPDPVAVRIRNAIKARAEEIVQQENSRDR